MKPPPPENPAAQARFGNLALIVCAALVLAAGGLVLWLKARSETAADELAQSKEQYNRMKVLKQSLARLQARTPRGETQEEDPTSMNAFISAKAQAAGLPPPTLRNAPAAQSGAWTEHGTTVEIQPGQGGTIPRGPFIDFLSAIERERPYLKSKTIRYSHDGHDLKNALVTISYFRRR